MEKINVSNTNTASASRKILANYKIANTARLLDKYKLFPTCSVW